MLLRHARHLTLASAADQFSSLSLDQNFIGGCALQQLAVQSIKGVTTCC